MLRASRSLRALAEWAKVARESGARVKQSKSYYLTY